jgi:hypothetical protein
LSSRHIKIVYLRYNISATDYSRKSAQGYNMTTADISNKIKKDTAEKIEVIINEYGKISKTLLKESGVHEVNAHTQTTRNTAHRTHHTHRTHAHTAPRTARTTRTTRTHRTHTPHAHITRTHTHITRTHHTHTPHANTTRTHHTHTPHAHHMHYAYGGAPHSYHPHSPAIFYQPYH